jgi:hypothetical protein
LVIDLGKGVCHFEGSVIAKVEALVEEILVTRGELRVNELKVLDGLISKFKITLGREGLGCTSAIEHVIDTGDAKPIKKRYYSYSPKLKDILHKGLKEYLEMGVVEPSNSPWASPVLLIPKSDGSYRWVVDLREVNKVTKPDAYPLPKVNDIIDQLRDAHYLSLIDLKSAYFQIPLEKKVERRPLLSYQVEGYSNSLECPKG